MSSAKYRKYRIRMEPFGFILEIEARSYAGAIRIARNFLCAA